MLRFINGIPFCLELIFIPNTTKARYRIWIGENDKVKFDLKENTIVGKAEYRDGFPLKYQIHPSLHLDEHCKFVYEKLIHRAIAGMLPKLFLKIGLGNIQFTPAFPAYVVEGGPLLSDVDIALNPTE